MTSLSRKALALALAVGIALPSSVFATNGYFLIGFGAKSRGMGGVGVAYGQDGLAAGANPATMADVKIDGAMRMDIGAELFVPKRAFNHNSATLESFPGVTGSVNHVSGANEFLIPSMGGIYKFNRKITIGMAAIGAGANTRYDQSVPGIPTCRDGDTSGGTGSTGFNFNCLGSTTLGVNLIQMQMLPSAAYRINKNQYVGASLAIGVQTFRAYGLQSFGPAGLGYTNGSDFTNKGNDWAYGSGVRFGWLGKFLDKRLSLGANYASRVYMTKFDKYKDLFAEQGDFDIPSHWALGLAFKATDKLTIAADYQKIYYSDIASVGNQGPNPADPSNFFPPGCVSISPTENTCKLGLDNGMGFGWQDADVYKLGVSYDYNDEWTFRAGYNHADAPMPEDQIMFNFLAPAVVEDHVTLGASYRPNKNMEWTFNYVHAFENTISGPTALGPIGGLPVNGTNGSATMHINTFGISFGFLL